MTVDAGTATTTTEAPPQAIDASDASLVEAPTADVAVIIVNWNTVDLLDECLRSIEQHGGDRVLDVVVVDNASADGSADLVRDRWPSVRLIANDENVGFCRANNQAIRVTDAPALLLINSDGRLTEGCLDAMLGYLERDPKAAIIGPRLEYGDGAFQRWTAGDEFSLRSCANHFLALDTLSGRFPSLTGIYLRRDTAEPFKPGWVSSAVMVVRREAFDDIGLLDEQIFVYMDDVDLCQRAVDGGWNVWYAADATAVHLMGASSKRETGRASPEALRSFNRWYARRHGKASTGALRGVEAVGFAARAAAYGAISIARRDPAARKQAAAHLVHLRLALEAVHV